ncbi:MAG: ferritin-like domain-containing protein [Firmicutes bacterium]|nr:ferritin-like domain-containing protein [Bacillota bacterium]
MFDRQAAADLLNQDLRGEHEAIVHYLTHAWTVVRPFGGTLEAIARDEMRHFKWLSHAIVALGGVPDLTPPNARALAGGRDALDEDIQAEEEAISQYEDHRARIANEQIKVLLARIVVDERDHRRRFLRLREEWEAMPDEGQEPGSEPRAGDLPPFQAAFREEYQEILSTLLQSFFACHSRQVGLRAEDRAIDMMKHLAWLGEALGTLGTPVTFALPSAPEAHRLTGWLREIAEWAEDHLPDLVPLIERALQHQHFDRVMNLDDMWTVGPYPEGGYGGWMS